MGKRTGTLNKSLFYFSISLLILWIILFEFILPENNVLPRPGIVLISLPDLFKDYHFLNNFFTTISAVYLPGILAYLFIFSIRKFLFSGVVNNLLKFVSEISFIIPALLIILIIIYWFPHSFYIEYVFSFLSTVLWFSVQIYSESKITNENYVLAFKSLGGDSTFINKNILWNEIKPGIFKNLYTYHIEIWTLVLILEILQDGYGLGAILRRILNFNDFAALILMIIFIPLLILGGYYCLKLIENKFVFWEVE